MAGPIEQNGEQSNQIPSKNSISEKNSHKPTGTQSPPNGGVRAWLQVLGSFLVFFNIWGLVLSFGVFQSFYQTTYLRGYSLSDLAWIGTTQVFCLNFVGVLTGPIHDLGYHDLLLYVSSFVVIFAIMMLSLSSKYYQIFLSQGLCLGIGSGILYVPSLALVAASFTTKRALAVTIVTAGSSIGGIAYPLVFRGLLEPLGFAWAVRVIGFIALGITAIAIPMLRTGQVITGKPVRPLMEVGAFKELPFVVYNLGGFLKFVGFYIPFVYIPIYAETHLHSSTEQAIDLLVYANAASFVGRLVAAWIAGRVGVMTPWTTCAFASGIICLAWLAVENMAGMITFVVLYGFFSGALIGLPSAVLPYVSPLNVLGTRMGMTWGLAGIALLVGSPIAGALVDLVSGDFLRLQLFCGICLLAGASLQIPLWWLLRKKIAAAAAAKAGRT